VFVLGITGPSGSGKSVFCSLHEKKGFFHIDTDRLAAEVRPCVADELAAAFGADILTADGINTSLLAERAFFSNENTEKLNKIMHSAIVARTEEILKSGKSDRYTVDGAALFEAGADRLCDAVCAVISTEDIRLLRVTERDGIAETSAKKRFSIQKSLDFFCEKADFIVENSGSLAELEKKAEEISSLCIKEK